LRAYPYPLISFVIPTLNEADQIGSLINYLWQLKHIDQAEIIVSDGGSTDDTIQRATLAGARVISSFRKGRAPQMNYGALKANGKVLYFVHADARPPASSLQHIINLHYQGIRAGCFSYRFSSDLLMLRFNEWFTRRHGPWQGGGDQTLFIDQQLFRQLNGFNDSYPVFEDFDLVKRLKRAGHFKLVKDDVKVSARKYRHNSWLRVMSVNTFVFLLFRLGVSPVKLKNIYNLLLRSS
jgi:rSAM/selenodomain-associated transferase 2